MTRSRSARKPHSKPSNRAVRRRSNFSVIPVATQTTASGADAVIPVSVTGEGRSGEAVIPVEVETSGSRRRRRAAVVRVAVRKRSATNRKPRARHRRPHTSEERREFGAAYPKPWRTFASNAVGSVLHIERSALELGVECGHTSATILRTLLWPVLGRPADVEPVGRSRELTRKTPAQVAGEALARAA